MEYGSEQRANYKKHSLIFLHSIANVSGVKRKNSDLNLGILSAGLECSYHRALEVRVRVQRTLVQFCGCQEELLTSIS